VSGEAGRELERTRREREAQPGYSPESPPRSWESMSMGEGRRLAPSGTCPSPDSPDGKHRYVAVSCVQSVEHFVCDHCGDDWWD
jgi:hypothetical protein